MRTVYTVLAQVMNIIFAFIALFLGGRIIFRLVNANPETPFVQWVYAVSDGFMNPFSGIFPNQTLAGASVLDLSAIIALIIYAVLAYIMTSLLQMIFRPTHPYITTEHTHIA